MSERQRKPTRYPYILSEKDRFKTLHVSRGDFVGLKWWARRQNITITEAIHDMIHAFMEPRLVEMRRQALEQKAIDEIIGTEPAKKPRRTPLFRRKRS